MPTNEQKKKRVQHFNKSTHKMPPHKSHTHTHIHRHIYIYTAHTKKKGGAFIASNNEKKKKKERYNVHRSQQQAAPVLFACSRYFLFWELGDPPSKLVCRDGQGHTSPTRRSEFLQAIRNSLRVAKREVEKEEKDDEFSTTSKA